MKLNINKIKGGEFTDKTEPKDGHLIELIEKEIKKEIYPLHLEIEIEDIIPFSSFKPELNPGFVRWVKDGIDLGRPPEIVVYYKDGKFIMSDNYNTYYSYKELKMSRIPCKVLGGIPSDYSGGLNIILNKMERLYNLLDVVDYRIIKIEESIRMIERSRFPVESDEDELFTEARKIAIHAGKVTPSLLVHHLNIGYVRAIKLLKLLEKSETIGPEKGKCPRDVLVTE